jgi:transposase
VSCLYATPTGQLCLNSHKDGKKRGGQVGHPGHQVSLVATPDQVETYRPRQCSACWQELASDAPSWVERLQVQELPPVRLTVTEHRIVHVRCPACGATSEAEAPASASAPQQYGPRLRALCAYLVQQQFIPYARVREVVADVFGTALSGCKESSMRSKRRYARRGRCITRRRDCGWWERKAPDWRGRM